VTLQRFVVDNSVVMTWCFADEANDYADQVLDSLVQVQAVVPAIWPLEVGNVLLVAQRRQRLAPAAVPQFLAMLNQLNIQVEQESPQRMFTEILNLARECQLSTYDASYLDLAMRSGLPIATLDKALRKAALKMEVPIYLG
jgi:predicted nucleic acid-binding protein